MPICRPWRLAALLLLAALTSLAQAGTYRLLLSSRADAGVGQDVYIASFPSFEDLINSPPSGLGGAFSGINVANTYIANGLAYDGKYRLLLSSRADAGAGLDVFIATFNTFDDLINSPPSGLGGAFSGINIAGGYIASGLTYDGKYRLLLSSRADAGVGQDVFIATFDTFDDLINSPPSGLGGAFSGINIASGYIANGLTYDGKYRLLLSSRADAGVGQDVYIASFDTFDDLINSPPSGLGGAFSGINIASGYIASGLAYEHSAAPPPPPPSGVPVPGSLVLGLTSLAALAAARRRWRPPGSQTLGILCARLPRALPDRAP